MIIHKFQFEVPNMQDKQLLPFISDADLYRLVNKVLTTWDHAMIDADKKLHSNVIDPFSAMFGCLLQSIDGDTWLGLEKARQVQKTLENTLGEFHQDLLSSVSGWEPVPERIVDIQNMQMKLVAEVKNKFNTTKGNHKKDIYDDLEMVLKKADYRGFKGYYVEVIPSSPRPYNRPFTPPDNQTGGRRPVNENIRVIDGKSFYSLATGSPDALRMLYRTIPVVAGNIMGKKAEAKLADELEYLFNRVYTLKE